MLRKWGLLMVAFVCCTLLAGCNMRTVDDLYQVPKRSDLFTSLQKSIDEVMPGREYSAPLAGKNLQSVQMADLDGDGESEYLLFTKCTALNPLQIYIFQPNDHGFSLVDVIEDSGTGFDRVEYVQLDDKPGVEIVLGLQLSKSATKRASVYTMRESGLQQVLSAGYSQFFCCDLNGDGKENLMILSPATSGDGSNNATAALYDIQIDGTVTTKTVGLSVPSERIKRIIDGKLEDGSAAVYIAGDVDGNAMVTDILVYSDNLFRNLSHEGVVTLREAHIYADDIDDDGVLELPALIYAGRTPGVTAKNAHPVICWYSVDPKGNSTVKMYTYHSEPEGWHLELDAALASHISVEHLGSSYEFRLWNPASGEHGKLFTVYALSGEKRQEQAQESNRFVLLQTESVIYAASITALSAEHGILPDTLTQHFHLTTRDWITGET